MAILHVKIQDRESAIETARTTGRYIVELVNGNFAILERIIDPVSPLILGRGNYYKISSFTDTDSGEDHLIGIGTAQVLVIHYPS
jgi:hypothetical protein